MNISGRNPVLEALKSNRTIDCLYVKSGEKEGSIKKILSIAKEKKVLIKEVDKAKLDELSEGTQHQGVVALVTDYKYYELGEVIDEIREKNEKPFFIILDEIEDPHNLGAIIRSAEGAGAHGVIIPKRRSAQVNATVEKVSAGATSYMKVIKVTNLVSAVERLKKENIWIYALDMDGEIYDTVDLSGCVALVVGNEGKGISRLLKENCDFTIKIDMKGKVNSLNASVAGSILLYEVVRQRRKS